MNRLSAFLFSSILVTASALGQKYDIASIPDSLTENANAVIRWDVASFEIEDINSAVFKSHQVISILRNDAKEMAQMTLWYDPDSKLNSIEASVYDSRGQLVKKLKKNDILDYTYSSISIYQDNRYKHIDLTHNQYPYTVELKYEKKYKNLFYAEDWYTLTNDNVSLEYSKYTIVAPDLLKPNIKLLNSEVEPKVSNEDGRVKTIFEFSNMVSKEREPYGTSIYRSSPRILLAPSKFNFDGYEGGFNSWTDFNNWMLELIKGRTDLPQSTVDEIRSLTKDLPTSEKKIRAVYEYLQKKTRYVSIQLGIGGFQPFPASMVDEMGYGDCKALSNYTHALLKAIDIPSHHVLVDAGSRPRPILKDFPNTTFNHMILCVPNEGDTLWLECTSQTNPFAYQGKFTGDRDVFLITESGGKIVHTAKYEKESNLQQRKANVKIDAEGNATARVKTRYQGLQYENGHLHYYYTQGYEKQKDWILDNTDIPSFELGEFSFDLENEKIPALNLSIDLELRNYGQSSGDRLFVPLNLMNKHTYVPPRVSDRHEGLSLSQAFVDIDTIVFDLPQGIHPEYTPEPVLITTEFGKYEATTMVDGERIVYVRRFEMDKGSYPKESYDDFRDFYKSVKKADKAKVVFLKGT